mgnify:CR=1 FL=1
MLQERWPTRALPQRGDLYERTATPYYHKLDINLVTKISATDINYNAVTLLHKILMFNAIIIVSI